MLYVETYNTKSAFDFGLALAEEQAQVFPQIQELIKNQEFLRTGPSKSAPRLEDRYARRRPKTSPEDDSLLTYSVTAPDQGSAPYLLSS